MPIAGDATADNAIVESWYDEENPAMTEEKLPGIRLPLPHSARKARHTVQITPHPIQLKDMAGIPLDDERWMNS